MAINKMTCLLIGATIALSLAIVQAAPATPEAAPASSPVIEPIIDWGKCPQLAPTEAQRKQKTDIIKACLDANPIGVPQDKITGEIVEKHRIKLGECALSKEDWFNADKTYKYNKAEEELNKKEVESELKAKIMDQHKDCMNQARAKYPEVASVIEQVQFYQSCMDFHVSTLCQVKIMLPSQ